MRWLMSLLLICSTACPAETVLFEDPGASNIEYRALLKANGRYLTPTQHYLATHPSNTARENLLKLYSEAQKALVSQSQDEARRRFQGLVNLTGADDWSRTEREIFTYAYLRLAQFEVEASRRDAWLANALFVGVDIKPDSKLFPPPILRRFEQLRAQAPSWKAEAAIDSEWSRALINGVPCSLQDCPRFPNLPVRVRVTFLSDKWQPQTVQTELSALASVKPDRVAWVKGNCEHTEFSELANPIADKKAFYSLACEKKAAISTEAPSQIVDLKPRAPNPPEPIWGQTAPSTRPDAKPFYRRAWFWAGLGGVILAGAVLANQKRGKDETQTSTTYGN